jgi:hypothetical protein
MNLKVISEETKGESAKSRGRGKGNVGPICSPYD